MIIPNGYIEAKSKELQLGGIDPETGYPLPASSVSWGEKTPCQVTLGSTSDLQAITKQGTQYNAGAYQILIEEGTFHFEGEQLRVTAEAWGLKEREFAIKSVTPLHAVRQIKIIV